MDVSGQMSGNNGGVQIAKDGPITIGGELAYNNDKYGLAFSKEHVHGVSDIMTQSGHVNLINNDKNRVGVSAIASQNKFADGSAYNRNGAEVEWEHKNGHSASAGIIHNPKFGTQTELAASANLWKSKKGNHSVDLSGGGSQWMSGPYKGKKDAEIGIRYTVCDKRIAQLVFRCFKGFTTIPKYLCGWIKLDKLFTWIKGKTQMSGNNGRVQIAKGFTNDAHNVIDSTFVAGSKLGGPITIGGKLAYNNDHYGLAFSKEHVHGVSDIMTQSGHVNLINSDKNRVIVSAFASLNKFADGFGNNRIGAEVGWEHKNGHSASAGISLIPKFGMQAKLAASANLWKSKKDNHRVDLSGKGSQWMCGLYKGQKDAEIGIRYTVCDKTIAQLVFRCFKGFTTITLVYKMISFTCSINKKLISLCSSFC